VPLNAIEKMKRGLQLLLLLLFTQLILSCEKEDINLEQSLVYYFPFSGNAVEQLSQTAYDSHGAMLSEDRFDQANSAITFQGSSWIDLHIGLTEPQGALSYWMQIDSLATYPLFISGSRYISRHSADQEYSVWLTDTGAFSIYSYNNWAYKTEPVIDEGNWHHLVLRWDKSKSKLDLFLDNVKILSQAYNQIGDYKQKGEVAHIAKGYNHTKFSYEGPPDEVYFKGKMDEIRYYNRWITDGEIKKLFENQ
jgi:hypothetical protein